MTGRERERERERDLSIVLQYMRNVRARITEMVYAAGPAQVLSSDLIGHFHPVFTGFSPLLARACIERVFLFILICRDYNFHQGSLLSHLAI